MNKLIGRTILNTRPLEQALPLAFAIEKEGGKCLNLPSFSIVPVAPLLLFENSQDYLNSDIWLFMSQYAVKYALPWLIKQKKAQKKLPQIGVVGKATALALEKDNISVSFIPENASSEGLLNTKWLMFPQIAGKKITIFRGRSGRTLLDETLQQRGGIIQECILYERISSAWTLKECAIINDHLRILGIDLALAMSIDSLIYFFSRVESTHYLLDKEYFFNIPWLVMSHRVAHQAEQLGIKKIHIVCGSNIFESLIRCCSFDTISI